MRPKIVAGNWKMNGNLAFVQDYMVSFKKCSDDKKLDQFSGLSVILVPPAILIASVQENSEVVGVGSLFELASQDVAEYSSGAYTGEISASMLKDFGCRWSLVGHSERRALFGDQPNVIVEKIKQLLAEGLRPILCLGETLEEREQGKAESCVRSQLESVLSVFSVSDLSNLVLAYEPVWAIGTGKTASPEEAQAMHKFIRSVVASKSTDLSAAMIVLYGGSVNSSNAESLFGQDDIDGALVGGASLKSKEFVEICFHCGQSALA
ncbi:MAG: triosephosphate isomerase [Oleiphilaceae bacterium]|jgi:triosephosphate isomerase